MTVDVKSIMVIGLLLVVVGLILGCAEETPEEQLPVDVDPVDVEEEMEVEIEEPVDPILEPEIEIEEPVVEELPNTPTIAETIALCDSLCEVDEDIYCTEERDIIIDENTVTGTCRAFSKTGNVDGFNRCEEFCHDYPKRTTECVTNGQKDITCSGTV